MSAPATTDAGTWSPLGMVRLLGLFLLGATFTSMMVQWSLLWGRLAHAPSFDDVNYLLDGLKRYYELHHYDYVAYDYHCSGSWFGLIWTDPPHSPFATYLAALSYSIWGLAETSPYYGNVIIVFGLLWAVEFFTRGIGPLQRVLLVLMALAFPLAALSVTEFRPDLAYSLATAIGCLLLVRRPLMEIPVVELVVAGFLFAAGLLIKTTTFPLVIAVMGTSLFVSSVNQLWPLQRERIIPVAWRWLWVLLPVVVFAVPFYIVSYSKIANYLHQALVASGDLYLRKVTPLERFTFYFYGQPLEEGLGNAAWVIPTAAILLLVGLGFGLRVSGWRYLRLLSPLFIAYVIMTLSPMKYLFAGTFFYWMLALTSLLILRDLWAACERPTQRHAGYNLLSLGLHLLAIAAVLSWSPPTTNRLGEKNRALSKAITVAERQMINELAARVSPVGPVSVFSNVALNYGIVPESVEYLLWLKGRTNVSFFDNLHTQDTPYLKKRLAQSDFVITTEGDNPYLSPGLKLDEKMDVINAYMKQDPRFQQIGQWELPYGNTLMLFQRVTSHQ